MPILPDCNRQSSAVPLWKVIVGPAPTNSANRTREGPVFFLCRCPLRTRRSGPLTPRFLLRCCRLWSCARAQADLTYAGSNKPREEHHGLDHSHPRRNLHRPRDQRLPPGRVLILRRICVVLNGAPLRHRAWLGGGGRFSTMELSLPDMPFGVGG